MAATAASLMWRGVGKCGSPAPKSTRLAPCARSLAASADTARVAETSIRPMRPVKTCEEVEVVIAAYILQILPRGQNRQTKIKKIRFELQALRQSERPPALPPSRSLRRLRIPFTKKVTYDSTRFVRRGPDHLDLVIGIDDRRDSKADAPLIGHHILNSRVFERGFHKVEFNG